MDMFAGIFEELDDPRTGNAKQHELNEILLIALCAVLCGGETCADMALFGQLKAPFLKTFMVLENGTPSHDTFSRIFRLLQPDQFRTCFIAFMQRFAKGYEGVVAIDGKTLRRSFDAAQKASPLHMVTAFAVDARLVLGQLAVDTKSRSRRCRSCWSCCRSKARRSPRTRCTVSVRPPKGFAHRVPTTCWR